MDIIYFVYIYTSYIDTITSWTSLESVSLSKASCLQYMLMFLNRFTRSKFSLTVKFWWLVMRVFSLWCENVVAYTFQSITADVIWTVVLENTPENPLDSKQIKSILREINTEYSLEGLMLKLKVQFFDHLMQTTDSLEKSPMLGKTEGRRRRGHQRMRWLDGITDIMNVNLCKICEMWGTGSFGVFQFMGVTKIPTRLGNWTTTTFIIGPHAHYGMTRRLIAKCMYIRRWSLDLKKIK